jgi:hypothetical protein
MPRLVTVSLIIEDGADLPQNLTLNFEDHVVSDAYCTNDYGNDWSVSVLDSVVTVSSIQQRDFRPHPGRG